MCFLPLHNDSSITPKRKLGKRDDLPVPLLRGIARDPCDQGAISSRRRSRVSTMRVAASAPIALTPANIRKTELMPLAPTIKPTSVGPAAEEIRSQDVAKPVPIARMRVG